MAKYEPHRWNVAKKDGTVMLCDWVSKSNAEKWCKYYLEKYRPGKAYPNGKGFYPDWGFHVIEKKDGSNGKAS